MTARDTTETDLLIFLTRLKLDAVRRLPVRPQDRHDDEYPEFDRECSRGDAKNDQDQER